MSAEYIPDYHGMEFCDIQVAFKSPTDKADNLSNFNFDLEIYIIIKYK